MGLILAYQDAKGVISVIEAACSRRVGHYEGSQKQISAMLFLRRHHKFLIVDESGEMAVLLNVLRQMIGFKSGCSPSTSALGSLV
jgi:hypothetical protein